MKMHGRKVTSQKNVSNYPNENRNFTKSQGKWAIKTYPANETVEHNHDIHPSSQIIPHVVRTPPQNGGPAYKNTARHAIIDKVVRSYAKDGGPRSGSVRHGVRPSYPKSQHTSEMMRGNNSVSHSEVHQGFHRRTQH